MLKNRELSYIFGGSVEDMGVRFCSSWSQQKDNDLKSPMDSWFQEMRIYKFVAGIAILIIPIPVIRDYFYFPTLKRWVIYAKAFVFL